jgi:hypothetical protein
MMRLPTVVFFASVLLVGALIACAPIDGSTVACDVNVTTDAGTGHWCFEDYGVPPQEVQPLQDRCRFQPYPFGIGVGTVRDACSTDDVWATCADAVAAPDGEKTVLRVYFYGPSARDAAPYELPSCPTPIE